MFVPPPVEFLDGPPRGSDDGGGGIWSSSSSKSAELAFLCFNSSNRSTELVYWLDLLEFTSWFTEVIY